MSSSLVYKESSQYYWDTVIFQVEGQLLQVPRYHLEKGSEFFQDMFILPQGNQYAEGNSDSNPIKLDGITTLVDFERFVEILYPSVTPWQKTYKLQEEWISILKLATMWRFLNVRRLAINCLTDMKLGALTRITLGRKYSVGQWLRMGYWELVKQISAVTLEEAETVGYPFSIHILQIRDEMTKRHWNRGIAYGSWDDSIVKQVVEDEFAYELRQVDQDGLAYNEN
ncbi:hypothetical protein K435DRAFT_743951 [Dendrothele bispora CBS 962.96]|uniref:BTB domain-containing protein n=1 Tax=Dendrothele bispora (strain CBS 962.96) TaxID=1314807 RepID=A0A4S8MUU5_DENBC|nr:hypothetical protein K435DRAFT_743951 [Dendrothele bispora CBS 962.96]